MQRQPAGKTAAIVDHESWIEVDATEDPFADRYAVVDCKPGGYLVEGDVLEINTLICNYLTARQPTRVDIRAGDSVQIVAWHLVLIDDVGTSSTSAHIAVRIADETVWEKTVSIPTREALYESHWVPTRDIAAGTDIYFHLHNHGFNSWKLGRLMVTRVGDGD